MFNKKTKLNLTDFEWNLLGGGMNEFRNKAFSDGTRTSWRCFNMHSSSTQMRMKKTSPESVIEAFVVKIVVRQDGFDWYLRFDGDPNDPLHMKTEGKRRKNSSVSVVGGKLPTKQNCDTGCYKEQEGLI